MSLPSRIESSNGIRFAAATLLLVATVLSHGCGQGTYERRPKPGATRPAPESRENPHESPASPPANTPEPIGFPPTSVTAEAPRPEVTPRDESTRVSREALAALAESQRLRDERCPPETPSHPLPLIDERIAQETTTPDKSYLAILDGFKSACQSCHLFPASSGKFTYLASWAGSKQVQDNKTVYIPGLAEVAVQAHASMAAGRMPPSAKEHPEMYADLATTLGSWIAAGTPAEQALPPPPPPSTLGLTRAATFSAVGDCLPKADSIGHDQERDAFFASTDSLPKDLTATDLFTFDVDQLAARGTLAYDVAYPLWTDNTGKARHIHLPSKTDNGVTRRQAAVFNAESRLFELPENTRVYKTFFRGLKRASGSIQYRPIETRLIVTRKAPAEPLFGTYVWDEAGNSASLLQTPYRNGKPWKDALLQTLVDEEEKAYRPYAVPARHRCVECHQGSPQKDFVLGFTPLQIGLREKNEGLRQVSRLIEAGAIFGIANADDLPKLETIRDGVTPSEYAIKAQAYAYGNCAHCHNPEGIAIKNHKVTLDLSPGQLYEFNTNMRAKDFVNRRLVDRSGDLQRSFLYFRMAANKSELGLLSSMPRHNPGGPDCEGLRVTGQWILSLSNKTTPGDIANFTPSNCTPRQAIAEGSYDWVEEDFTEPPTSEYQPRRQDWPDPSSGMNASYRELRPSRQLDKIIRREYAVDFWQPKEECEFPDTRLWPWQIKPWMNKPSGEPKQAYGQLYKVTPGAWLYQTTCAKCHGPQGRGDGEIGRALVGWSGGQVKVADFSGGMFGRKGANLDVFNGTDARGRNYNFAPNYFIWMAMEGTKIQVPPQADAYLGKHKAQMLRQIKDRCARQIPTSPKASSPRMAEHQMFKDLCLADNKPATSADIQYDPATDKPKDAKAQESWLDRAAINGGWAIYQYLEQATKNGKFQPTQSECERR